MGRGGASERGAKLLKTPKKRQRSALFGKRSKPGAGETFALARKRTSEGICDEGQAKKSVWRMPRHQEPKKDVTSCDKPRGGANNRRAADFRMGKPVAAIPQQRILNKIGMRGETR